MMQLTQLHAGGTDDARNRNDRRRAARATCSADASPRTDPASSTRIRPVSMARRLRQ